MNDQWKKIIKCQGYLFLCLLLLFIFISLSIPYFCSCLCLLCLKWTPRFILIPFILNPPLLPLSPLLPSFILLLPPCSPSKTTKTTNTSRTSRWWMWARRSSLGTAPDTSPRRWLCTYRIFTFNPGSYVRTFNSRKKILLYVESDSCTSSRSN